MLFTSLSFLMIFLPIVIFIYYVFLIKSYKLKNALLLVASIIFYAIGEPRFVFILSISIIVNWIFGFIIRGRKILFIAGIFLNVLILFNYKYLGLFVDILANVLNISLNISIPSLPIGISFFTFQAISYLADVYMQRASPQKNLLNLGLYLSFFPQLIAGPIVRYQDIELQILKRKENIVLFSNGVYRFVCGFIKKMLLSNTLSIISNYTFEAPLNELSVSLAWLGAISYTLHIFFDFCGYSDMAIGLGKMFGFNFNENFNYPYIASSISEFWQRWHISLGTWFRDYIYFPLGGSRTTIYRTILNLFVVWILTGAWHGASLNFIAWGLLYFILISLEKLIDFKNRKIFKPIKHIYTMFSVIIGWVIFRSKTLESALVYLSIMFNINNSVIVNDGFIFFLSENFVLLISAIILCFPIKNAFSNRKNIILDIVQISALTLLFLVSISYIIKGSHNPFIYFNF